MRKKTRKLVTAASKRKATLAELLAETFALEDEIARLEEEHRRRDNRRIDALHDLSVKLERTRTIVQLLLTGECPECGDDLTFRRSKGLPWPSRLSCRCGHESKRGDLLGEVAS